VTRVAILTLWIQAYGARASQIQFLFNSNFARQVRDTIFVDGPLKEVWFDERATLK
jgi:hypothetical protein